MNNIYVSKLDLSKIKTDIIDAKNLSVDSIFRRSVEECGNQFQEASIVPKKVEFFAYKHPNPKVRKKNKKRIDRAIRKYLR